MNVLTWMRRLALLGLLLTACATSTTPTVREEDEASGTVSSSWQEARADPSCVVPLCDEERCAVWRCRDVVELEAHPVLLAQATIVEPLPGLPQVHNASRWWGVPLAAPTRTDPARALLLRLRREATKPRMDYFRIEKDKASDYTGSIDGTYKWALPGIICPLCKATWSGGVAYPSVDLTPVAATADFEKARAEPAEEFERPRELVRPLMPPGAVLEPGTELGPFTGRGQGRFGSFVTPVPWLLMVRREALEKLQAEGLRGLKGCRTLLRFRQRESPALLELEILPMGRLHPDCLPPGHEPPCPRCGRRMFPLPRVRLLDAATLPNHLDLFRLGDFPTVIVCTERFADACHRLGLDGITFQPLPVAG